MISYNLPSYLEYQKVVIVCCKLLHYYNKLKSFLPNCTTICCLLITFSEPTSLDCFVCCANKSSCSFVVVESTNLDTKALEFRVWAVMMESFYNLSWKGRRLNMAIFRVHVICTIIEIEDGNLIFFHSQTHTDSLKVHRFCNKNSCYSIIHNKIIHNIHIIWHCVYKDGTNNNKKKLS